LGVVGIGVLVGVLGGVLGGVWVAVLTGVLFTTTGRSGLQATSDAITARVIPAIARPLAARPLLIPATSEFPDAGL
jgi:hypothetical protein